jgi:hypothetical protein
MIRSDEQPMLHIQKTGNTLFGILLENRGLVTVPQIIHNLYSAPTIIVLKNDVYLSIR